MDCKKNLRDLCSRDASDMTIPRLIRSNLDAIPVARLNGNVLDVQQLLAARLTPPRHTLVALTD